MKPVYNSVDPEKYDRRRESNPAEKYEHNHWRPIISRAINQYCQNKFTLDLGCGTGACLPIIVKQTPDFLGLDNSPVMLKYAQRKYGNLNMMLGDAHHLPIRSDVLDCVVAIGLFEYIERIPVLKEINRVLKSGGIVILQMPNRHSPARTLSRIVFKIKRERYFPKEPSYHEMLELFRKEGFQLIESRMDDGLLWLPLFLSKLIGNIFYPAMERLFKIFRRNPFSYAMMFVVTKP